MNEEEQNLVNKTERWINKEEEYFTNEGLKEILNILDKYVDLYKTEKEKIEKIEDKIKEIIDKIDVEDYYCLNEAEEDLRKLVE